MPHEKAYLMEIRFYYNHRQIENIFQRIFISILMPTKFTYFCQKIGFKSALGSSLSGQLRTALRVHLTYHKKLSVWFFFFRKTIILMLQYLYNVGKCFIIYTWYVIFFSVPCSFFRSLSSSRLRPNGAKHLKSSGILGAHSAFFNGTASSHFRRQDPGGGQAPLNSGSYTHYHYSQKNYAII